MASRFCTRCGQLLPTNATQCPRCNAPVASPAPAATLTSAAPLTAAPAATAAPQGSDAASTGSARRSCANCRAPMRWIGHFSLRATGQTPPAGGAGSEAPETLLPFSLYYCQTCGKFDFYYPGT